MYHAHLLPCGIHVGVLCLKTFCVVAYTTGDCGCVPYHSFNMYTILSFIRVNTSHIRWRPNYHESPRITAAYRKLNHCHYLGRLFENGICMDTTFQATSKNYFGLPAFVSFFVLPQWYATVKTHANTYGIISFTHIVCACN